jgi:hypothetical protein
VVNTAVAEGDAASFVAEFIQRVQPEPPLALSALYPVVTPALGRPSSTESEES